MPAPKGRCGSATAAGRRPTSVALRGTPGGREQTARAALDEEYERHQHYDLAQHGACIRLENLVDDPEGHAAEQRAPEAADAAEHHHHEGVHDVGLTEVR